MINLKKFKDKNVYLYGAGVYAKRILDSYQGVDIAAFIDTYKEGSHLGKEIFSFESYKKIITKRDLVIISTGEPSSIREISSALSSIGVEYIIHAENDCQYDEFEFKKMWEIKERLVFGANIYQMVIDARSKLDFSKVEEYYFTNIENKEIQYFGKFPINLASIIFDGGTFDGKEAELFSKLAPQGKVFTFDPWGNKFLSGSISGNIFSVQKALWNKDCSLYFSSMIEGADQQAGAYVSETQDGGAGKNRGNIN